MEDLFKYELARIKKRGFWLIPGVCLFSFYFICLPSIIKPLLSFLISKFSEDWAQVVGIVTVHHSSYIIHCALLSFLAFFNIQLFERYRVGVEWPFHLFNKAMKTMAINFCFIIPVSEYLFIKLRVLRCRVDEDWPNLGESLFNVFFCIVFEDIWSYIGHRIMHTGSFYRKYHKKHHEYKASIGYSAEYAHPVEYIGVNILATGFGPLLLGQKMHFLTFLVWISYRIGDTIDQHGGYDFPWAPYSILPFSSKFYLADSTYHDFHHTRNNGNYSSQFVILDYLCGTVGKKKEVNENKVN